MEVNKKYGVLFVTITRYFEKEFLVNEETGECQTYRFIVGNQYKWVYKQYVPPTPTCGCTIGREIYLVKEDRCGRQLPRPIEIDATFCIPEASVRPWSELTYWEERRGEGKDIHTPSHLRTGQSPFLGKDGYLKTGV